MSAAYLTTDDARTRAATLSGLAALKAASDADLDAALMEASDRVDVAYTYQGRKYDVTPGGQPREFPRIPHDDNLLSYPFPLSGNMLAQPFGTAGLLLGGQVWDLDADGNVVVPDKVLAAVMYEADAILAGDASAAAKEAQHAGLSSQSVGSQSESYRAATAAGVPLLCRRADAVMRPYRVTSGGLK